MNFENFQNFLKPFKVRYDFYIILKYIILNVQFGKFEIQNISFTPERFLPVNSPNTVPISMKIS